MPCSGIIFFNCKENGRQRSPVSICLLPYIGIEITYFQFPIELNLDWTKYKHPECIKYSISTSFLVSEWEVMHACDRLISTFGTLVFQHFDDTV